MPCIAFEDHNFVSRQPAGSPISSGPLVRPFYRPCGLPDDSCRCRLRYLGRCPPKFEIGPRAPDPLYQLSGEKFSGLLTQAPLESCPELQQKLILQETIRR